MKGGGAHFRAPPTPPPAFAKMGSVVKVAGSKVGPSGRLYATVLRDLDPRRVHDRIVRIPRVTAFGAVLGWKLGFVGLQNTRAPDEKEREKAGLRAPPRSGV